MCHHNPHAPCKIGANTGLYFLLRGTMLSAVCFANFICLSVCPSVRLSACAWIVSKRLNISSKFFHCVIYRPIILAFRHQGLLRKSDVFIPNAVTGAPNTREQRFSTKMRLGYLENGNIDRAIFTLYLCNGSSDPLHVWFYMQAMVFRGRRIECRYFQLDQIQQECSRKLREE